MSNFRVLVLLSFFVSLLLCVPFVCSVDPPVTAPSPPPESGSDIASPPSNASASSPSPLSSSSSPSSSLSPSPSQSLNSPPAPPPSDLAPGSAPTLTPAPSNAPAPAPSDAGDVSHAADSGNMKADEHSSGMSSGKKVGIAFGVVLGLCAVGLGALVYKKRRQNIRRSEFGYATRDML